MPVEPEDLRAVAAVAVAPQRTRVDDEAAAPRLGIVGVLLLLLPLLQLLLLLLTPPIAPTATATLSTPPPARYSYCRALG